MNTASLRHETTQMAAAHNRGYFDAEGSPHYYITDWQGNNAAVVNSSGTVVQKTDYYPYGEPAVEPSGQVNKWNREAGEQKYDSRIVEDIPAGPNARERALQAERDNADRLRDQDQLKDKNFHKRP